MRVQSISQRFGTLRATKICRTRTTAGRRPSLQSHQDSNIPNRSRPSTSPHSRPPPQLHYQPLHSSALPIRSFVALALPLLGYAAYIFGAPQDQPQLNSTTFTPFTLLHHQRISSTSSILTLRPPHLVTSNGDSDPYAQNWMQGTWSLELKHPQLSISRRYTPLPPPWIPSRTSTLAAESTAALQPGDIKLLVRKYDTGEVSRYLHSLKPGSTIECRGPYSELEIPPEASKVLFLAGGTGVAAGLQVAGALARRGISEQGQAKEMMMLWANRRREEVVGLGDEAGRAEMNEMVTMVEDLERKAETVADVKVRTKYFVDEENRFIQRKDLEEALRSFSSEQGKVRVTAGAGQDEQRQKHDKLVLVTGPDGFVEYFAGPKRVRNGVEVTGMTGGLLSQMKLDGWTVVRL